MFILIIVVALVFLYTSYRLRALTLWGMVAVLIIATVHLFAGFIQWLGPPLTFLLLSSIWTRWPGKSDQHFGSRNIWQVISNGLPGLIGAIMTIFEYPGGTELMVGSYAAAAADTWATEWGTGLGGKPVSLRTMKKTKVGDSGAISVVGLIASVGGALSIALVSIYLQLIEAKEVFFVIIAGVCGSSIDSIAGAWFQRKWKKPDGAWVENKPEDFTNILEKAGLSFVDNNVVNLICASVGGLVLIFMI